MAVNMNTPNSRMIINLLMKNAAKYKENTEPEQKAFTKKVEIIPDKKRNNTIDSVRIKKKKKIEDKHFVDEGSYLDVKNIKDIDSNKIKREMPEYTEIETKHMKDENSDSEEESKHKSTDGSFIMKLLRGNIDKYKESALIDRMILSKEEEDTKVKSEETSSPASMHLRNCKGKLKGKRKFKFFLDEKGTEVKEPKVFTAIDSIKGHNHKDRTKGNGLVIPKIRVTKAGLVRLKWTKEEDEVLLEAMDKFGGEIELQELSITLKRNIESVRTRIHTLRNGHLSRGHRPFSLIEDQLLIDIALKQWDQYPDCTLEQLRLRGLKSVEDQLHRPASSCWQRWDVHLKPWILQHFSGTLNLDIRRMLANYVADNFQDVDAVDWISVAKRPKFVGHSIASLRFLFFNSLYRGAKKSIPAERKVTLEDVASYANAKFKDEKTRLKNHDIIARQRQVINYFEKCLEEQGKANLRMYFK